MRFSSAKFSVSIVNRTRARAEQLAGEFGARSAHGIDALPRLLAEADVLINNTSLGRPAIRRTPSTSRR